MVSNIIDSLKKEDLEGEIKDFPLPVVKRMLKRQLEQTDRVDLSVFVKDVTAGKSAKGFSWHDTFEGRAFWFKVIGVKDFAYYFERYPEELPKEDEVEIDVKKTLSVLSSSMVEIAKRLAKVEEELKSLKKKYDTKRRD